MLKIKLLARLQSLGLAHMLSRKNQSLCSRTLLVCRSVQCSRILGVFFTATTAIYKGSRFLFTKTDDRPPR
jgi:hypothetical protein